jgi:TonB family protein
MLVIVKNHGRAGRAILSITVDADGKMRDRRLVREEPAGLNIGAAAMKAYATAKFIPGFRNGKPVACTFEEDWAVRGYRYRRW